MIPRTNPKLLRLLALGAAAAVLVGVAIRLREATAAQSAPDPRTSALRVRSLLAEAHSGYAVAEGYNGRVVSRRSSQLGFPLGGLLEEVAVEEGDRVETGQLLARLDSAKLQAARRELDAQVEETRARLELARRSLDRTQKLAGHDSISEQRHDEARFEAQALAARLDAARAGIERIDVDLRHSALRAPYDGAITHRVADEGTILAPGQEVLHLIERDAMEARVGVPPTTANQLETGRSYPLRIDHQRVDAELVAIIDEVASDTRTVTAVFRIDKSPAGVRHGALARLSLETRHDEAGFWLPISSLSESRRGLWSVFALVPDAGSAELYRVDRRELQLIHTESDRAFLRGTLQDGERVVATGIHRLVPDQLVRLER